MPTRLSDDLSQEELNTGILPGWFYLFSKATGVQFGVIWDFPKGGDRLRMWILVIFNTFFFSHLKIKILGHQSQQ